MATGRPDYTGETVARLKGVNGTTPVDVQVDADGNLTLNVKRQDLGYLTQRPMYGAAKGAQYTPSITANADTTILTINGSGMLYSCCVCVSDSNTCSADRVKAYIDGSSLMEQSFLDLSDGGFFFPGSNLFTLDKYDDIDYKYNLSMHSGITFDTSFQLVFTEVNGNTPIVKSIIRYALLAS